MGKQPKKTSKKAAKKVQIKDLNVKAPSRIKGGKGNVEYTWKIEEGEK